MKEVGNPMIVLFKALIKMEEDLQTLELNKYWDKVWDQPMSFKQYKKRIKGSRPRQGPEIGGR